MVRTECLNEDEHAAGMLFSVKQMMQEGSFCDFIIKVGCEEYHAHRIILSAGSPYFKAMLKHDTKERQEGKVEMSCVDSECVKSCLDFMYSGKLDIPDEKIGDLLHVALVMQLDKIKTAINNILEKELNVENFYGTRSIADMFGFQSLSTICKSYYEENLFAIAAEPGFEDEDISNLVEVLKSESLKWSEKGKLDLYLRWIEKKPERKKHLFELISHVNLHEVPLTCLQECPENHPIFINDPDLCKKFSDLLAEVTRKRSQTANNLKSQIVLFSESVDHLQVFDSETNKVVRFHDKALQQSVFFSVISMDSYIYVFREDQYVHRLDVGKKNSEWEVMQNMPTDHGACPPAVSLLGYVFVIAASNMAPSKDVERFDPNVNHWVKLSDKPHAITDPTLVSLGDSIYCIGGYILSDADDVQGTNRFCRYTPLTSEWVDLEPMAIHSWQYSAVAAEQKIFATDGFGRVGHIVQMECYDVTTGQWSLVSPLSERQHTLFKTHHINGWIFVVGYRVRHQTIKKYDIANDKWHEVELKDARHVDIDESVLIMASPS